MSGGGELCFALNHLTTITCWRLSHFPSQGDAVWIWKYVVDVASLFQKYSEHFGLGGGSALSTENLYMILEKLGGRPYTTNCFPMSGLNGRVSCRLSTDCKNCRGGSQPYSLKTFWNFSAFQNPTVGADVHVVVLVYHVWNYFALNGQPSPWEHVVDVFQKCPEDFGLIRGSALGMEVRNMVFCPALPHILYLQIRVKVISYDLKTSTAELVYDFGESWWKTHHYNLFSYRWPQWMRL